MKINDKMLNLIAECIMNRVSRNKAEMKVNKDRHRTIALVSQNLLLDNILQSLWEE